MPKADLYKTETDNAGMLLYDNHAPALYRYIYRQMAQPQDAEDVLLDVFIVALRYKELPNLPSQEQLAWLQGVARRKIIDAYRHQSHIVFLPLDETFDVLDEALTPEELALRGEVNYYLYAALAQLPLKQQQLIRLRYGNGLRFSEITVLLEQPEGTLRKTLLRILRRLRTLYATHS